MSPRRVGAVRGRFREGSREDASSLRLRLSSEAARRVYGRLLEGEREQQPAHRPAFHGGADDLHDVVTRGQRPTVRAAAGETERVTAGKQVAQPGEQPDPRAVRAPEVDVERRERSVLRPPADTEHAAGVDGEKRGREV